MTRNRMGTRIMYGAGLFGLALPPPARCRVWIPPSPPEPVSFKERTAPCRRSEAETPALPQAATRIADQPQEQ